MEKEQETILEMVERFKRLTPNINIKTQPESALKELIEFEKNYNMNTNEAMQLMDSIGEKIHFNDDYIYLRNWYLIYRTYGLFNGDDSLINTICRIS